MVLKSKYSLDRIVFLFILTLCLTGSVVSQIASLPPSATDSGLGGSNSIVGTILGPSGTQLAGRVRILLSTMTRGDRVTMTDETGSFAFRGLPAGNYILAIDKEKEYVPVSQTISIIQFRGSSGQTYTANIRLTLKPNTEAKPGVVNSEFANVPKSALTLFEKAQGLATAGDRKGAIEQLQLAIAEYPDFMLAYNEIGVQHMRLNELEKADESFRSATKIKPEAFAPLMNRGIVLVSMKRFADAEPVLRDALKSNEQSAVGHYFLGQALANLGKFDEAEKELAASITLGGGELKEAHRLLAIIYSAKGDKKRAAGELETYLRLAPTTPDADQLRQVIQQLRGAEPPAPGSTSPVKPAL